MRRETGHHTRVTEGAPRRLLAARGRLRYGSHDAGSRHNRKRSTSRDSSSSDGGKSSRSGKPRRPKKNAGAFSPLPGDGARSAPASWCPSRTGASSWTSARAARGCGWTSASSIRWWPRTAASSAASGGSSVNFATGGAHSCLGERAVRARDHRKIVPVTETVTRAARQRATGRHFPRHRSLAPEGASNRECRQRRAWTERTVNPEVAGSSPVEPAIKLSISVTAFAGCHRNIPLSAKDFGMQCAELSRPARGACLTCRTIGQNTHLTWRHYEPDT